MTTLSREGGKRFASGAVRARGVSVRVDGYRSYSKAVMRNLFSKVIFEGLKKVFRTFLEIRKSSLWTNEKSK